MRLTRLALVALLLLPIIEIVVIVAVGQAIGGWPTFLLLVATSLLGAWLIRREGGRAWRALEQAVRSGRMPAREIADGVVVLVGGGLLLAARLRHRRARPAPRAAVHATGGAQHARRGHLPAARRPDRALHRSRPVTEADPGWEQQQTPQGPQRRPSSDEVVEGEIIDED